MMKIKTVKNRLYQINIPIIGITGGIACGKTTFSTILYHLGYSVINADQLVKQIYKNDETIQFIKKISPESIEKNEINFKKLRPWFFNNPENQSLIENFIYEKLKDEFIRELQKFNNSKIIFYDIPLLFERGLESKLDLSVCLYVPRQEQIKRLMLRDQITRELAENILSKQMNIEEKKEKADIIINNTLDQEHLQQEAKALLEYIDKALAKEKA